MTVKKYPSDFKDQALVRFPDGMRDWLKATAAENNRSMNGEIIFILREKMAAATGGEIGVKTPAAASSNNAARQGGASITQDERTV